MAFLEKTVVLGLTDTELYVCPATLSGSAHGLTFSNITGVAKAITLKLFSQATGLTTQVTSSGQVIPANGQFTWPKPINMVAGDKIIALADAIDSVVAVIAVYLDQAAMPSTVFVPRGEWSNIANYAVNDVAVVDGTSYLAVAPNLNSSPPSSNWVVLAAKGHADGVSLAGVQTLTNKTINLANNTLIGLPDGSHIKYSARTSNTALAVADKSKLIDITSGTFTQTFVAATTLGDGWFCYLKNSGTGDITLDPNGAETIDGLTSYVMYPGEVRLVQCDGTALRSVVLNSFYRVFTASGTFNKPPGYKAFSGLLWSAGAGGGANQGGGTGGAAGGGCFPISGPSASFLSSESFVIGAGGAGLTTQAVSAGGNSSFGSKVTVFGAGAASNTGGSVITGNSTGASALGFESALSPIWGGGCGGGSFSGSNGTASIYGGGGSAGVTSSNVVGGSPGTSGFGGAAGASVTSGTAASGTAPGGAGGCSGTGGTGGTGARGELRIWGII